MLPIEYVAHIMSPKDLHKHIYCLKHLKPK